MGLCPSVINTFSGSNVVTSGSRHKLVVVAGYHHLLVTSWNITS